MRFEVMISMVVRCLKAGERISLFLYYPLRKANEREGCGVMVNVVIGVKNG